MNSTGSQRRSRPDELDSQQASPIDSEDDFKRAATQIRDAEPGTLFELTLGL